MVASNKEYMLAQKKNCTIIKRAQLLSQLSEPFKSHISVVGTHGKTTTTSLIVHIFNLANKSPSYFIGGHNINNGQHIRMNKKDSLFITELDESDGSFLDVSTHQSVITNIEFDHMDYYPTKHHFFDAFSTFVSKNI